MIRKSLHTSPPLVTIVIPCYKQAHFLHEAIESARSQTYSNLEILVIDDGSPDNTSEVAARYPDVQCIRQKNGGLSDARNTGIRASQGEFLVLLDADDKLLPNCLEAGIACFVERPEAAIVFGRYQVVQEDGTPTNQLSKLYEGEDLYRGLLASNCISMVAAVMFRREIFDKVGYFKPALACVEDYDLYLRIASRFPSNRHHEVVAEYRVYGSSGSNDLALMLRGVSITLKSQRKNVKGNKEYEDVRRAGLKFWREYYGESLYIRTAGRVWDIKQSLRIVRDLWYLLRYYPQVVTIHGASRLNKLINKFWDKPRYD